MSTVSPDDSTTKTAGSIGGSDGYWPTLTRTCASPGADPVGVIRPPDVTSISPLGSSTAWSKTVLGWSVKSILVPSS